MALYEEEHEQEPTTTVVAVMAGLVAGRLAGFVAHKVLSAAWTRTTGKEPPHDPQSPDVRLREALGWAVITGVCIQTAELLAVRTARRRLSRRRG